MRWRSAVVAYGLSLVVSLALVEQTAFAFCTTPGEPCRASGGDCDPGGVCDANGRCVGDIYPSGTVCRAATDLCDKPEVCNGSSPVCPASTNERQPAGTMCRASSGGPCDVADFCDGSSTACPNRFQPATTPCRTAVAGGCDITEFCTGTAATCPTDAVEPNTKVCRPVAGMCDVEEKCNGSAATCPADILKPSGASCRAAIPGGCDIEETCSGSSSACPADVTRPDDSVCSDNEPCTVGDACRSGRCVAGEPPLLAEAVDFGPALVGGSPRTAMLMLSWRDTGNISVTGLTSSSNEFSVAVSQAFPIALSPSAATASVALEFSPVALGARTATLSTGLDPATCPMPPINLVGTGAPPGLSANPTSSDFERVDVGTSSTPRTFRVVNLSGAEAIIQSVTSSDAVSFEVIAEGLPATLAVDASYTFTVVAKPETGGAHSADITIVSNSATTPTLVTTVRVEGTCDGAACQPTDPGGPGGGSGSGETPGDDKVSPLACSAGGSGAGWAWIALAFVAVARRARRR